MKRIFSKIHRENISKARKGIKFSEEHKEKLRLSHIGQKTWNKGKKTGIVPKTAFKKGDVRIMGENNPNWNGGKGFDGKYMRVTIDTKTRKREHRYLMEQLLGRRLNPNEVVHHVNHNKLDNRIDNLELMSRSEHSRLHMQK